MASLVSRSRDDFQQGGHLYKQTVPFDGHQMPVLVNVQQGSEISLSKCGPVNFWQCWTSH